MIITKKILLSLAFAAGLASMAFSPALISPAQADSELWKNVRNGGLSTIGEEAYEGAGQNPTDIRIIISRIIKAFLGLLGIIFLLIVVMAGYQYMTANGDEGKVEEALGRIKTGVIGLIIVLAAYSITLFVTAKIYNAVNKF